jgi:H+/Cl- antiporter ClcA
LRGGPTFPALFLGAAAGIMTSHLPSLPLSAGVALLHERGSVSMHLPLSAIVIASLLASNASLGLESLVIVGVVAAYLATLGLSRRAHDAPHVPRAAKSAARPSSVGLEDPDSGTTKPLVPGTAVQTS